MASERAEHRPLSKRLHRAYVVLTSMALAGCGSRSAMTELTDPVTYHATQQDDRELAQITHARQQATASADPAAATQFAALLTKMLGDGLIGRRQQLGEPVDVNALATDCVAALERAAQSAPAQAASLYLTEAKVWKALGQLQRARAVAEQSFQAAPNFAAFRFMTYDLEGSQKPTGHALDDLCATIRPRVRYVGEVSRAEENEIVFEIVNFLDSCHGVCRTTMDGPTTTYEFCDWVSPKEAKFYRLTQQASHAEDEQQRRKQEREIRGIYVESCYQRCDRDRTQCTLAETTCMAEHRACFRRCERDHPSP